MALNAVFEKLECINEVPAALLDNPEQRLRYKTQLRKEVANYKQREALYAAKRRELLLLELDYRRSQGAEVAQLQNAAAKSRDQESHEADVVIALQKQVKEASRELVVQLTANSDLVGKIKELQETYDLRRQEHNKAEVAMRSKKDRGQRVLTEI